MDIYYDEIESPVGTLTLTSCDSGALRIDFGAFNELTHLRKWAQRFFKEPVFYKQPEKLTYIKEELNDYFQGRRRQFSFELDFYGTSFQKQVWQALGNIPYGETSTYQGVASSIGNPKAVRAVGGAVNKNPLSIVVPCHRVIGSNGQLTGYGGGLDKKEWLLSHEAKN